MGHLKIISGQARIGGETNYNVWVWLDGLHNALKFGGKYVQFGEYVCCNYLLIAQLNNLNKLLSIIHCTISPSFEHCEVAWEDLKSQNVD